MERRPYESSQAIGKNLIDFPCLDCGSPIRVEMKDGVLQKAEPEAIMGYTPVPFRDWFNDLPYA